jgi:uncharacterized pyridoxal phosphate-containing UPF0001 family protein
MHIVKECKNLKFAGLMTIGRPDPPPDQPDFTVSYLYAKKELIALK